MPLKRTLLALLICATAGLGAELKTLKGEAISGTLVSLNDKEAVFTKGADKVTVPLAQILAIDFEPAGKMPTMPYKDVELVDGTILHCNTVTLKGKDVEVELFTGPKVTIPTAKVSNILINANDEKERTAWAARLAERREKGPKRDMAAVLDKDNVVQFVNGTLDKADDKGETIAFTLAGDSEPTPVKMTRIRGLFFHREADPTDLPRICKVSDTGKNLLMAAKVTSGPGGLTIATQCGVQVEYKFETVARLDYSMDKIVYLSDVDPLKAVELLGDERFDRFKRDTNLNNGPIRLGGVVYPKGLSMFAPTELEYDLKGDYVEFRAMVGIDDQVLGADGEVVFRVLADGKLIHELKVSRKDKKRDNLVVLNIKDRKKLKLIVTVPDDVLPILSIGRHLDLADVKVSK